MVRPSSSMRLRHSIQHRETNAPWVGKGFQRSMIIYGVNPTVEALRAGTVAKIWVRNGANRRVEQIVSLARRAGISVCRFEIPELNRLVSGEAHQGIVAELVESRPGTLSGLLENVSESPLIVVLDGIEDPRNFGAVARTAEAAGVDGMVYQKRRSALVGATAAKVSAGALAHIRLAAVVNVSRALEELKRAGVWTVGLDNDAKLSYHNLDLTGPIAFVIGAEGKGLRRLVRERCDWCASIPMCGQVSSLNVSVAAGVALFEAVRQRDKKRVDSR